nr:PREDICTED: uncharacterized protein LOC107398201 [Tribolium castaneum]|eukprot:XP_015836995.1 PREDICTED: uncharacterized protein LOC107398201 [Tribolium castaneum]
MICQTLFFISLTSAILIPPVLCVRTCHFCADTNENCLKNDKAMSPTKMNCDNFLIRGEEPHEFFQIPQTSSSVIDIFYKPALRERNVKTLCLHSSYIIRKVFHLADVRRKFRKKSPVRKEINGTFKTCMYRSLADYDTPCKHWENWASLVFRHLNYSFKLTNCTLCKVSDCNASTPRPLRFAACLGVICVLMGIFLH